MFYQKSSISHGKDPNNLIGSSLCGVRYEKDVRRDLYSIKRALSPIKES